MEGEEIEVAAVSKKHRLLLRRHGEEGDQGPEVDGEAGNG